VKTKIRINNNPTVKRKMINKRITPKGGMITKKTSGRLDQLDSKRPHRTMSQITSRLRMKDQMTRGKTLAVSASINKTPTNWQKKMG
jgi:hypothetical protein